MENLLYNSLSINILYIFLRIRYGFNYLVFLIRLDFVFVVMEMVGKCVLVLGGSVCWYLGIFWGLDFLVFYERSGFD